MNDATYAVLHANWVKSGYERLLTPTINRVDNKSLAEGGLGYVLGNVEWLPLIENTNNGVQHGKAKRNASEGILVGGLPSNWRERLSYNRNEWVLWFPNYMNLAASSRYDTAKGILSNVQYRVYFLREILQLREVEIAKLLKVSQPCVSATLKRISGKLANPAGLKRAGQIVLAHGKAKTNALNDKEESLDDPLTLSKWTN